ncbi:hypothetical protein BANRA_05395 [Escherichia coli]|nr:hypothetical protein BANRA_05395 [Escherichia coli]
MFCPRKSNPLSIWVISVFFGDKESPRSAIKASIIGFTFSFSSSDEMPVTTKSSAYRDVDFVLLPVVVRISPNASSLLSSPSSAILASTGDIGDPCGVPEFVELNRLFSINPAFSHFLSTCLSNGMLASNQSWLMLSKAFDIAFEHPFRRMLFAG